jgi:hypothetical protein
MAVRPTYWLHIYCTYILKIKTYFATALARMPILFSLGGIEACPPEDSTLNSIASEPFSATPILYTSENAYKFNLVCRRRLIKSRLTLSWIKNLAC